MLLVCCLLSLGLASTARAQTRSDSTANETGASPGPDGWRQLGGPRRNFRADAAEVAIAWGEDGPTRLWSRPLGEGYSSILADGDLLVTMYRRDDEEVVVALDAATGATRWEHAYRAPLVHNGYFDVWLNSAGPGPYATPLIVGDTVFAVGVDGLFHALDKRTGDLRWAHDLAAAFEVEEYNAFASSPIAYGQTVIQPLGGSGHGVVAFDRETGATAWRSPAIDLGPGSPLLIEVDGQDQLVVVGQQELVGLDPGDGRRLWSHPHPNELGLNLSMPVWGGDRALFVSSGYDGGSRLIRLSRSDGRTTPAEVWSSNRMRVHFGNALRIDGMLVASTGDFGPAFLAAVDAETGAEVWRERTFARGADGRGRRPPRPPRRGRGAGRGVGHPGRAAGARARARADLERLDSAHPRGEHLVPARPPTDRGPRSRRPEPYTSFRPGRSLKSRGFSVQSAASWTRAQAAMARSRSRPRGLGNSA